MTEPAEPQLRWFALYTNIKCEHRAQMGLREKGFRTFYPTLRKWSRVGRVKKPVDRPLFTRYIFVGIAPGQGFGTVRMTDGVESVVGTAGQPMEIPAAFISRMTLACANGTFDYTVKPKARIPFVPGQNVRFEEGPFQGFIGKVKAAPTMHRVELLVEMLGRIHSVVADPLTLKAA